MVFTYLKGFYNKVVVFYMVSYILCGDCIYISLDLFWYFVFRYLVLNTLVHFWTLAFESLNSQLLHARFLPYHFHLEYTIYSHVSPTGSWPQTTLTIKVFKDSTLHLFSLLELMIYRDMSLWIWWLRFTSALRALGVSNSYILIPPKVI